MSKGSAARASRLCDPRPMHDSIRNAFRSLRSSAAFFALRYVDETREILAVRQDTIEPPRFTLDRGVMITAVTNGGYGYASTSDLSLSGLQAALDKATAWADAASAASVYRFSADDLPTPKGRDRVAPEIQRSLSRSELYDLVADECRNARIDERIVERYAALELRRIEQLYLTNTGGDVHQSYSYATPSAHVTANQGTDTQVRSFLDARQGGLERVGRSGFVGCGRRLADEALQLLVAPNCPAGRMDLLLMPDQMMLQIHESIGHPLELDRILGDERNYAGTSFVTPEMFGSYRYGSDLLNVTYDPTIPGELATYAFDDDGAPATKVFLIRNGILVAPLGGHLSQARAGMPGTANARSSGWNRPAIDRMANINVEPGTSTLEEMIASISRGVLMRTNLSWSIDDSRNKFQFGCEWGELIENGKR